jgi:predicted MFS family arabinose efflux permease
MPISDTKRFERRVLLLMAMVQFINIWDFMIVMPLGPDFARALGISVGHIGWIAGSYSISAAIVGIIAARFLDRFDRRSVLLFNLTGLMIATFSMIMARNLTELIAVRVVTGMFGGQAIASSLAVIADVFPEQRRGEALGKVFGSFSIASVVGVPLGLEIAQLFGWQAPFIAISLVAAATIATMRLQLPPLRMHLKNRDPAHLPPLFADLLRDPAVPFACLLSASNFFAMFMLIPNISAHVQENMDYPRQWLGLLYFSGGAAAFFSMRLAGKYSDRAGYAKTALYATCGLWLTVYLWFYLQTRLIPIVGMFVVFMICSSTRNITSNALISRIPKPYERAGFMSLMSSVQHLMSGAGAMCGTLLLKETPAHRLAGMHKVALLAMVAFAVMPMMMFHIEKIVKQRKADTLVQTKLMPPP